MPLFRSTFALVAVFILLLAAAPFVSVYAQTATPMSESAAAAARVIELTNAERAKHGLSALAADAALGRAAQVYAPLMAGSECFSHTCGGTTIGDRVVTEGYSWWTLGENIAAGQRTPEEVVAGWMTSAGHRANLLNADFRDIGVGVATGGPYGIYWVQAFGSR